MVPAPAKVTLGTSAGDLLHIPPLDRPMKTTMLDLVQEVTEARTDYCPDINDILVLFYLTGAIRVNDVCQRGLQIRKELAPESPPPGQWLDGRERVSQIIHTLNKRATPPASGAVPLLTQETALLNNPADKRSKSARVSGGRGWSAS